MLNNSSKNDKIVRLYLTNLFALLSSLIYLQMYFLMSAGQAYYHSSYHENMYTGISNNGYNSLGACMNFESTFENYDSDPNDFQCPQFKMLRRHISSPMDDCHPSKGENAKNCLSDTDCCEGSYCCLSVCEGITRCYNPSKNQFTAYKCEAEKNKNSRKATPAEHASNLKLNKIGLVSTKATSQDQKSTKSAMQNNINPHAQMGSKKNSQNNIATTSAVNTTATSEKQTLNQLLAKVVKLIRQRSAGKTKVQNTSSNLFSREQMHQAIKYLKSLKSKKNIQNESTANSTLSKDIVLDQSTNQEQRRKDVFKYTREDETSCAAFEFAKEEAKNSKDVAVKLAQNSALKLANDSVLKFAQHVSGNWTSTASLKLTQETALYLAKATALKISQSAGLKLSHEAVLKIVHNVAADLAKITVQKLASEAALKLNTDEKFKLASQKAQETSIAFKKQTSNKTLEAKCTALKLAKEKERERIQNVSPSFNFTKDSLQQILLKLSKSKSQSNNETETTELSTIPPIIAQFKRGAIQEEDEYSEQLNLEYSEMKEYPTSKEPEASSTKETPIKRITTLKEHHAKQGRLAKEMFTYSAKLSGIQTSGFAKNPSKLTTTTSQRGSTKSPSTAFVQNTPSISKTTAQFITKTPRFQTKQDLQLQISTKKPFVVVPTIDKKTALFRKNNPLVFESINPDPDPIVKTAKRRFRLRGFAESYEYSDEYESIDDRWHAQMPYPGPLNSVRVMPFINKKLSKNSKSKQVSLTPNVNYISELSRKELLTKRSIVELVMDKIMRKKR